MTPNKKEQKKLLTDIMEQNQKNGLYPQQTAVDWVVEQIIRKYPIITQFLPNNNFDKEIIEQAKAIEKEQIEIAFDLGRDELGCKLNDIGTGEKYYNETYGKE